MAVMNDFMTCLNCRNKNTLSCEDCENFEGWEYDGITFNYKPIYGKGE